MLYTVAKMHRHKQQVCLWDGNLVTINCGQGRMLSDIGWFVFLEYLYYQYILSELMQCYLFFHVLFKYTDTKNGFIFESCDFWKIDTWPPCT